MFTGHVMYKRSAFTETIKQFPTTKVMHASMQAEPGMYVMVLPMILELHGSSAAAKMTIIIET